MKKDAVLKTVLDILKALLVVAIVVDILVIAFLGAISLFLIMLIWTLKYFPLVCANINILWISMVIILFIYFSYQYYLYHKKKLQDKNKSDYDIYLENLLNTVKKEGILVEKMEKGTPFIFEKREQYKKDLGVVPVKNRKGKITNVYMVYEDFDDTIKYYDYPQ